MEQDKMDSEGIELPIEIGDPEIDAKAIVARIRNGLVEHDLRDDVEFPAFAMSWSRPSHVESTRFPKELYDQLEQANHMYAQAWVELSLIENQMPLLGPFITDFKRELHRLIVYYVNLLGERQITINEALLRVLNLLVDHLESEDAYQQVKDLQRQVDDLRDRLEKLESADG
jgi:hypothetical protein